MPSVYEDRHRIRIHDFTLPISNTTAIAKNAAPAKPQLMRLGLNIAILRQKRYTAD